MSPLPRSLNASPGGERSLSPCMKTFPSCKLLNAFSRDPCQHWLSRVSHTERHSVFLCVFMPGVTGPIRATRRYSVTFIIRAMFFYVVETNHTLRSVKGHSSEGSSINHLRALDSDGTTTTAAAIAAPVCQDLCI